jgi:type VI secretion system secreted protein Hcp
MAIFAKFDGVDGESKDEKHDKWIDVLNVDWGMLKPGGNASGQTRRRGTSVINDLSMTFEYEKAAPKLFEKQWKGEVIPKLEIEHTATYGGARETYLKITMEKVSLTSLNYNGTGGSNEQPPTVHASVNCEKGEVVYTEWDDDGGKGGEVKFKFESEKGA